MTRGAGASPGLAPVDGCDEVAHARDAEQLEARNNADVAPPRP